MYCPNIFRALQDIMLHCSDNGQSEKTILSPNFSISIYNLIMYSRLCSRI